ncbi:MAG TPA: CBS domain-containing protein [Candidatus Nanoarchaeia archaeon]|nr:CBS domain-containing protein [Candidatus Nanoarchaeia archaeon]
MSTHDLSEIKKIRKKLGLTQSQLAKKASVSQSLIAKIEAEKLDPGYSKTKQIFDALEQLTQNEELAAADIMNRKIMTAKANDSVADIIKIMKKHAISQMPVVDSEKPVGMISEHGILDSLSNGVALQQQKAKDIMEDCPPIITPQTKISVFAHLLRYFPIVLIVSKGKLEGLISKADVIERIT